jgi:putative ABC transport system permease protein
MHERPPIFRKFITWFLSRFSEKDISLSILDYLSEKYTKIAKEKSTTRALIVCTVHFFAITSSLILEKFFWSFIMLKNYLKITFRTLFRQKSFSFINITGLSVGIACCIFIFLYVQHETSFDSFHKDADRIFRIVATVDSPTGITKYAGAAHQLTPYIRENLSQSAYAARVTDAPYDCQVRYEDRVFKEQRRDIPFVDEEILKIFLFDLILGNPNTALSYPKSVVITEKTAKKYFGRKDPLGKVLTMDTDDYEVTGVLMDLPDNTVFRFNMLRSWKNLDPNDYYPRWQNFHRTYIKLAEEVDPKTFEQQITRIVIDHSKEELAKRHSTYKATLQPITDVYLHSEDLVFERNVRGNSIYIYIFTLAGIIILLIASVNYVNLTTARSSIRAREVGLRKVIGARQKQLFFQFISESIIVTLLSFVLAVVLALLLLNWFNDLAHLNIGWESLVKPGFIFVLLAAGVVLGSTAGIYPALVLSSFKPVSILKGKMTLGIKSGILRRVFVIFQFSLSIAMITGVVLANKQINYMKKESLGFEKEQRLVINVQGNKINWDNYFLIKEEFSKHPLINGAAFSSSVPGRVVYNARMYPKGQKEYNSHNFSYMEADRDFVLVFGLEIIAGTNLENKVSRGLPETPCLMNETAVKLFGFQSADEVIGKLFGDRRPHPKVIGVVKDYHLKGLQNAIEPLGILLRGSDRYLTLQLASENIEETMVFIANKYKSLFPNTLFEYFFLDEDFNRQYQKEDQTLRIFGLFTILGILIACLGLFSLAAFVAEQRTKEIGIRKALGASVASIVNLLSKEFLVLVIAANVVAWPISYFIMHRWLQSFAYRIHIGPEVFIFAGLTAIIIAVMAVGYQSLRAAMANPVDSLRNE